MNRSMVRMRQRREGAAKASSRSAPKKHHTERAIGALVIALFLMAGPSPAQNCPAPQGTSPLVEDQHAETRLAYLMDRLPRAELRAKRWYFGWLGTYSTLSLGQAALVPAFAGNPYRQRTFSINAASAGLGALFLAVSPPRLLGLKRRALRRLEAGATPCVTLHYVETELARAARKERFGKSWVMHGANVLFNFGVGLALGLAWGYWDYAFYTRSGGILLGEMLIWTRPQDANHLLADYAKGTWTARPTKVPWEVSFEPWLLPHGGGLSVRIQRQNSVGSLGRMAKFQEIF